MRAIVLGANGFLGSNMLSELMRLNVKATAFCYPDERAKAVKETGVEVIEGDFLKPETLDFSLSGYDWVIHMASTTTPKESVEDPKKDEANLTASSAIFRRAVEAKAGKILFPSSGGTVYGDLLKSPAKETHPTKPMIPYTRTKVALEQALFDICRNTSTVPIILRYGNPYGPNQYPARGTGVVTAWLEAARDSKPITLFGEGKAARDFIYVSDAVDAAIMALESKEARGVYNIGSGVATTLFELVLVIEKVTKKRLDVNKVPPRPSDVVSSISLDSSRASNDFGWNAKVGLDEGIKKTWKWVKRGEQFVVG